MEGRFWWIGRKFIVSRLLGLGLVEENVGKESEVGVGVGFVDGRREVGRLPGLAGGIGEVRFRRNDGRWCDDQDGRGEEASMTWV